MVLICMIPGGREFQIILKFVNKELLDIKPSQFAKEELSQQQKGSQRSYLLDGN